MELMRFAEDLREFLRSLGRNEVEYLLIGGYAVSLHGFPRTTGDLDLWIRPTAANIERVLGALRQFGFQPGESERKALGTPGSILRLGYPPVRIELLNAPSGVEFAACRDRAVTMQIGGVSVPVLSLDDLVANKRAAGRPKDLIDAMELERIRDRTAR
jgi:predicted nucleotidyltransferase